MRQTVALTFAAYSPSCPQDGESRTVPHFLTKSSAFHFLSLVDNSSIFNPLSVVYLVL